MSSRHLRISRAVAAPAGISESVLVLALLQVHASRCCSGSWPASSHCRDRAPVAALPCTFSGPGRDRRGHRRNCPCRSGCRPGRAGRRFRAESAAPPDSWPGRLWSCPAKPAAEAISFRLCARPRFWPICRQMARACCSLRRLSSGLLNIRKPLPCRAGWQLFAPGYPSGRPGCRRGSEDRDCPADRRS